ncbi:MAG: SusC/RagA family TonB-linked outer membrane protein [Christiangramia sp.]|uniref:SusC, outer membrane protein involved in starch binding n=1 Tax=Christiangramia flava JLT2011 TaxID=1229726 RepID=A0A1L7I936_9FLAO|nr:SusC/RagA family TonB-linked outer membrane protein [Christiangramia flava]APU69632.1 SusC, outer membrane protein involved in starch binding [Christiangramia flava JLT2011]MAM19308.1 SusC/RagA family TonB-linked outer membrane protein [Christiangramia sp.]OSS39337.1 SusC outer membrane protein [Christiangramia flava JLT2011]
MKKLIFRSLLCAIAMLTFSMAQAQTVSGTVTDESGPLPGVNVSVKGTSNGTTTDFDGNYTLNNVPGDATLVFSFVGFETQELGVGGRSTIDVNMTTDASELDEVVLIGYGQTTVRDATGAVASVSSEDFNKGNISSPEELIQGKTAGVQITQASGEPGAGIALRIRGTTSVRSNNNPLFVVDGVPLAGDDTTSGTGDLGVGSGSARNPLNFLNPSDIESISVLKDASATAIYGSRGANGVVIIQTKSGRGMRGTSFSYDASVSVANASNTYDLLNREQFLNAVEQYGGDRDAQDFGADTDWQDVITRTAFSQNHAFSFMNSYKSGNLRLSLGYNNIEGVVENSEMERLTGRLNANHRFFDDKLNLSLQATLSKVDDMAAPISNNAGSTGDLLGAAYYANPTWPAELSFDPVGNAINPLQILEYVQDQTETNRALINFSADYDILDNLNAKVTLGYDKSKAEKTAVVSGDVVGFANGAPGNGRGLLYDLEATNRLLDFVVNYEKEFENSNFSALLGYSFQDFHREGRNASAFGFASTNMDQMVSQFRSDLGALEGAINRSYQQLRYSDSGFLIDALFPDVETGISQTAPSGISTRTITGGLYDNTDELQSFFTRLNYSLMDKYLFTFTMRADGSSRFGPENRYGYFPSAAFAWKIDEEAFMPDSFSTFKLRLGYGITGNQEGLGYGNFTTRRILNGYGIDNGGNINGGGLGTAGFANPDLKWEETSQANVGVDFGFANDRLSGSLDFYYKDTQDLLLLAQNAQPSPAAYSFTNIDGNVINKGVEFAIEYDILDSEDFFWNLGFNISYNDNELRNFDGLIETAQISGQGLTGAFAQLLAEGRPLFSYYLREFAGYDANGISIYPNGDQQEFVDKSALPTTNLGINTRAEYKNFDASLFFSGQYGFYIYNNTANAFFTAGSINSGRNVTTDVLTSGESPANAPDVSTRFLEKGDFLRLQNASIGYTFDLNENSFLDNLRLYVNGQNLFVITDYSGLDPEVNTQTPLNNLPTAGIDYTSFPRPRTFTFGLNAKF